MNGIYQPRGSETVPGVAKAEATIDTVARHAVGIVAISFGIAVAWLSFVCTDLSVRVAELERRQNDMVTMSQKFGRAAVGPGEPKSLLKVMNGDGSNQHWLPLADELVWPEGAAEFHEKAGWRPTIGDPFRATAYSISQTRSP